MAIASAALEDSKVRADDLRLAVRLAIFPRSRFRDQPPPPPPDEEMMPPPPSSAPKPENKADDKPKDNEEEKEDDNKTKLRKVIKKVANKNIRLLPQFREKHPDYDDAESTISDKYSKMVIEAMGGAGNNDLDKEDKIIQNISKNVCIEK